ncbi:MAG: plastocyanin/azurin family copper-binding protein [Gaiellaceae bacterium]
MSRIAAAAAGLLCAGVAAGVSGGEDQPALEGTVGPGFSIQLRDASGAGVRQLDPGTYAVVVRDLSEEHNLHLMGPGVDQTTEVETAETFRWTVALAEGRYEFYCDPHVATMMGQLTVGTPPPLPPPAPPPRRATKLNAAVGPGRAISVRTAAGAKVTSLRAGRYALRVRDRSAADNFHLTGPGVNRRTAVVRTVSATWTLTLARGVYTYRSDAHPALRGSFRVRPAPAG